MRLAFRRIWSAVVSRFQSRNRPDDARALNALSTDELLSLVLHNCHRIEKSYYNGYFTAKLPYYTNLRDKVLRALNELQRRGVELGDIGLWARAIVHHYKQLQDHFIKRLRKPPGTLNLNVIDEYISQAASRRSCRVWAAEQLDANAYEQIGQKLVEAATWAPNSGNRQAWRFAVITDPEAKSTLKGLKEPHCYRAPLLIFVGIDARVYTASRHLDDCRFLDAGAAIMQMIAAAHAAGLGTCWNHLSRDLVDSRPANRIAYRDFSDALNIPAHVAPAAILAVGIPAYIPPTPIRRRLEDLLLKSETTASRTHSEGS